MLPEERFLPLRGVYPLERTVAGEAWRWLAREAVIRLPSAHLTKVTLTFRLSPDTPYDSTRVQIAGAQIVVTRQPSSMTIPATPQIEIHSDEAFVPATVLHNRDPRILSIQLLRVVQSR